MIADAIASLGTSTYTLEHRANNGFDANGRVIAPTITSVTSTGLVEPLGGRELERLQEGLHAKELRAYWTTDTLTVADHDARVDGDWLNDGTTTWEIVRVEDWSIAGGYSRYIISRVDP